MSRIILQPTSNPKAKKHFRDTIENPVDIKRISRFVDNKTIEKLQDIYPDGNIYVWGVTNGKKGQNEKKWEKISRGDVTLFSQQGGIFSSAVTTMVLKNKELAKELWGIDSDGNTWENIYFLEEIKKINIPYERFNNIVGYKNNNVIQGFNVLDEDKSEKLFSEFNLLSDTYFEEISDTEYKKVFSKLKSQENLDTVLPGNGRKEQAFLRKYLFKGKKTGCCGICGRDLPVDMLITSHIKQRSECTNEERVDYENVVMPMCKFGCDDLYEKGYIYVDDLGKVRINSKKKTTKDMDAMLDKIEGKSCSYFIEESKKYFEAHRYKYGI